MSDPQLLQQAEQVGRFLIEHGVIDPPSMATLFDEYRAHLAGGGRESILLLLRTRGRVSEEQARYLMRQLELSASASTSTQGAFVSPATSTPPSALDTRSELPPTRTDPGLLMGPPPPSQESSFQIAGFEILGELGKGGQGIVYRARDQKGREVALKTLSNPLASERAKRRFGREREAMEKLDHPNIVEYYDSGTSPRGDWISMELVEGQTLSTLLKSGALSLDRKVGFLIKVARAIHAAHAAGVVHRDLKPSNVVIDEDDEPKVMDFGLVKKLDGASLLTKEGAVIGTPFYLAPEQISSDVGKISPLTDVWALGIILYEMLTGQRPFTAETSQGLYRRIVEGDPEEPDRVNKEVPRGLADVCLKAICKKPEDRYASAEEFAADLALARKGEVPTIAQSMVYLRPVARKRLMRRVVLPAAAVITLLLLVGIGGAFWAKARARGQAHAGARAGLVEAVKQLSQAELEPGRQAKALESALAALETARGFVGEYPGSSEALELEGLMTSPKLGHLLGAALLQRARASSAAGRPREEVEADLTQALAQLPDSDPARPPAQLLGARLDLDAGRIDSALGRTEALLDVDDEQIRAEAGAFRARVLEERGEPRQAAQVLLKVAPACGLRERDVRAEAGRLLAAARCPEESESIFTELAQGGEFSAAMLLSQARARLALGDAEEAAQLLGEAAHKDPENAEVRRQRVALLVQRGRLAEAFADVEAALAAEPDDAALTLQRARLSVELGRISEAREDVTQGRRLARDDTRLLNEAAYIVARILAIEQRRDAARAKLDELLHAAPRNVEALRLRAALSVDRDARRAALQRLLEVAPRDPWGQREEVYRRLDNGQPEQARELAKELLQRDPGALEVKTLYAIATGATQRELAEVAAEHHQAFLAGLSRPGRARRLLALPDATTAQRGASLMRLAALEAPNDPEALALRARCDEELSTETRLELAEAAVARNPECLSGWWALAELRLASESEAKRALEASKEAMARVSAGVEKRELWPVHLRALIAEDPRAASIEPEFVGYEEVIGKRAYALRAIWARALGDEAGAKKEEAREAEDDKRVRALANQARPLIRFRQDYKVPPEKLAKALFIIEEAAAIDRRHPEVDDCWADYHLAAGEGVSPAIYRGALQRKDPEAFPQRLRFAATFVTGFVQNGVTMKITELAQSYGLDVAEESYCLAFMTLIESFSAKDVPALAEKMLAASERCLALRPDSTSAYLPRAHAQLLLGREAQAQADWALLERNGGPRAARFGAVLAYTAAGRIKEAVKALQYALSHGVSRSDFDVDDLLGPLLANPEAARLLQR